MRRGPRRERGAPDPVALHKGSVRRLEPSSIAAADRMREDDWSLPGDRYPRGDDEGLHITRQGIASIIKGKENR